MQVWTVDLVELGCPALAAASCVRRARTCSARLRRAWSWLAAACASWACGQAVWSTYELLLARGAAEVTAGG